MSHARWKNPEGLAPWLIGAPSRKSGRRPPGKLPVRVNGRTD